jgi:hypothetical protein
MLLESPSPCDAKAARDFHPPFCASTIAYRENRAAVVTIILFEARRATGTQATHGNRCSEFRVRVCSSMDESMNR